MTLKNSAFVGERGIITVAFGAKRYLNMAKSLGESVRLNWKGVQTAIVTDVSSDFFADTFDFVIPLKEQYGRNLMQKLHLDEYSPFKETIFLDSDCLVTRSMDFVWESFSARNFTVSGSSMNSGEWFGGDIEAIRNHLGIGSSIPKFNGGLMYWKEGDASRKVFSSARELSTRYTELGFNRFRLDLPVADEPLISLAMAVAGETATNDHSRSMATPIGLQGRFTADVVRSKCSFIKNGQLISPAAPHFCGPHALGPVYLRETLKLRVLASGLPNVMKTAAVCAVQIVFAFPAQFDRSWVWDGMRGLRKLSQRSERPAA